MLMIAGRSGDKAAAFAAKLPEGAEKVAVPLDRNGDLEAAFAGLQPDIVVDATGPFQTYGEHRYRVVEACLAAGIDYLDLADGSDFVSGINAFDDRARAAGTFVLAGVSSFPVLTAAVVRELSEGLGRLDTVTGGIAPSPFAKVGGNVIRAVAGYAGKPVKRWRDGALVDAHGLTETMRYTIAPPGRLPLRNILFSLVDVPDLRILHDRWPELRTTWIGAGPVPEPLHRALIVLARLVRWRIIPTLSPLAPLFHFVMNRIAWGEDRGGMFVTVTGADATGPVERSWHLLAEGTDGPLIPSMACAAIIRHCLDGKPPAPGARAAAGELSLADYGAVFAGRTIVTGVRETRRGKDERPLYRRLLDDAYPQLPEPIRAMHELHGALTAGHGGSRARDGLLRAIGCRRHRFPEGGKGRAGGGVFLCRRQSGDMGALLRGAEIQERAEPRDGPIDLAPVRTLRRDDFRPGAGGRSRSAAAGPPAMEHPWHPHAHGFGAAERFLRGRRGRALPVPC